MKVVILAGGLGTRLSEETVNVPKPMVEIGGRPILWHIMKTYAHYGHADFILTLGYKGDMIKDYFRNYFWNTCDVTLCLGADPEPVFHNRHIRPAWAMDVVLMPLVGFDDQGGRLGATALELAQCGGERGDGGGVAGDGIEGLGEVEELVGAGQAELFWRVGLAAGPVRGRLHGRGEDELDDVLRRLRGHAGELRHHAAEFRMQLDLAVQRIPQQPPLTVVNGHPGLVAGRFDT